jgi:ABC-2 type transport system permease protein
VLIGGQDSLSIGGIAATAVLLALFGLVFGGVALLASAVTGRRKLATWVTTGVALVTWFMFSFLSIAETTEPVTRFSPWSWYLDGDPLLNGMDWTGAALLGGTFLVLVALSFPFFRNRDLRG